MTDAKAAIDGLMDGFFAAVSFSAGGTPAYDGLPALLLDAARLVAATADVPEVSTVDDFVASRRERVDSGALTEFSEAELSETTQIFGRVAQRFSAYEKRGVAHGSAFAGRGVISTQFVLTKEGWRISAMAWDDE